MDWLEKERDELRAAVERTKAENLTLANQLNRAEAAYTRVMAALRGIAGMCDPDTACGHVCISQCVCLLRKLAAEATAKEEGGGK